METGDLVAVWASATGVPQRFEWQGRRFEVCGRPVPWIDRAPWWSRAAQVGTIQAPEQRMWRVAGMDTTTGEVTKVDLAVEVNESDWWRLTYVQE